MSDDVRPLLQELARRDLENVKRRVGEEINSLNNTVLYAKSLGVEVPERVRLLPDLVEAVLWDD